MKHLQINCIIQTGWKQKNDETTVIHPNEQSLQNEDDEDRTIVNSEEIIPSP